MKTMQYSAKVILLLGLFTCLFTFNSIAQTDFNLSDYKNPDYQYRSLDFNFGLSGNNMYNKQSFPDNYNSKYTRNSFNGNLDTRYFSTKNSKFYQGSQTYRLNYRTNGYNDKFVEEDSTHLESSGKSFTQNLEIGANSANRFYNNKKRFVEVDLNFSGGFDNQLRRNEKDIEAYPYKYENRSNDYQVSASIPLLIGTGRIEQVQDARLAVYILDDLLKSDDLKRTPEKDEIVALAEFITQTKNQRFFDSRLRKIAEITAIDSFLTVRNLKGQSDASYYTLLNDNWDFSNGPVRSTGSRFSIGIAPQVYASFNELKESYHDTLNSPVVISYNNIDNSRMDSWGLDAMARYVYEKPINLTWQQTSTADLRYSLYNSQSILKTYEKDVLTDENKVNVNDPNVELFLSHVYDYYPNSRTNIQMGASARFIQHWTDDQWNDDPEVNSQEINIHGGLSLYGNYYFSPQLRFSMGVHGDYLYSKNTIIGTADLPDEVTKSTQFASNVSAHITYSLF
ncbi:MAG: hypothetical protein HOO86_04675 [Bacteroidales bacterium]|nr:hypothetical protein [Bacteroidales bacterium]